ncbi:MAG: VWA domain-containing protein [Acidobacteriia bacterium]|nr:VWA domain-containing protein [Terriglobia bacterium]
MSSRETPVTFTSRVNLVLVPVVVRDNQGHAIGTLRQEDFQLFDKGKPQLITRFSVEKPASPFIPVVVASSLDEKGAEKSASAPTPGAVPERFVAYLFDDIHLNAADLLTARTAADRHLSESFVPGGRAAIYTTSGQIVLDFTDDRDKLRETLNRIQPLATVREATECLDINYYWADAIITKSDAQATAAATDEVMACRGYPADQRDAAASEAHATAMSVFNLGERESRLNLSVLKDVIRRLSATPGSRNVILVSPGFFLPPEMRIEEAELMDRAIRANVTVNSLDVRGVYTVIPGGDASQPGRASISASNLMMLMKQNAMSADSDVLEELADATGGRFFHNDNGLFEGFRQLVAQPEYIYILGFSPQNLKLDGARHGLKVALKNPKGFEMQARNAYYAPSHAVNSEEQAKQEIQEAVFSRDEIQDLPVDLNLQYARAGETAVKLNVLAKVNLKLLHFRKADDRNLNTLTVVASVFDRNGNFVAGIQKIVDMRLRDQTLDSLNSAITVKTTLDVTPGSYLVRLVVRDSEGQTMSARNGVVEIPF